MQIKKGGITMKTVKMILLMSLLIVFLMPATQVLAGGEPPNSDMYTIEGPALWAVGVIDCGTPVKATLRIKSIDGCQVETQAIVLSPANCPASENDLLWKTWEVTLFGINPDPASMTPIITKVKNFKSEAAVVSFDAQIKFRTTISANPN
jgi:hypothetical protein